MRRARGRVDIAQRVAEHLLDNLLPAQPEHRAGLDPLAVAQHRQGVADGLQLVNAVGDKDHADALLFQAPHHRKQPFAFVRVQRGGGFIENQKTAVMRERPREQNLLLFRQRAAVNGTANVERDVKLRQRLPGLLADCAPAVAMPRLRQLVEHDIFCDAQTGDQRDVHLLLHQVNAQPLSVQRLADRHRLVVNTDLTFVAVMGAAQHRHQRRFSRAVCAGQRVHGSAR